jgi:hypothetical protein
MSGLCCCRVGWVTCVDIALAWGRRYVTIVLYPGSGRKQKP